MDTYSSPLSLSLSSFLPLLSSPPPLSGCSTEGLVRKEWVFSDGPPMGFHHFVFKEFELSECQGSQVNMGREDTLVVRSFYQTNVCTWVKDGERKDEERRAKALTDY